MAGATVPTCVCRITGGDLGRHVDHAVAQLVEPNVKLIRRDAQLGVGGRMITEWQGDSLELIDQVRGQLLQVADRGVADLG